VDEGGAAVSALGRLFLRPYALWNAFLHGSLVFVVGFAVFVARGGVRGEALAAAEIHHNSRLVLALGAVLMPHALGTWVGWSLYELLGCTFAPTLPGLRRRLLPALVGVGLAGSALCAWWCGETPGPQSLPLFFALAFPCYALGILWSDSAFQLLGPGRWVLQIVALLPILLAPEVVSAFESAPLLLGSLGVAAGLGLLLLPFRRSVMRVRVLHPDCADRPLVAGKGPQASWNPGRTLSSTADWTRAVLHEAFGHAKGGWVGAALGHALVMGLIVAGLAFVPAFARTQDLRESIGHVHAALMGRTPGSHGKLVATTFALPILTIFFLFAPFTLGGGGSYPLGRRRRAEATWRASATATAAVVLALALVLGALSEVAFRVAGLEQRFEGIPLFLHALASVAVTAPLAHAIRLRWLDEHGGTLTIQYSGMLGLLGLVLGLPATFLTYLWVEGIDGWSLFGWASLMALEIAGAQAWWRQYLLRFHETRDLVT
jgi:hypothetical protein